MADISRDELSTIIQEEYASILLAGVATKSAVLAVANTTDLGTKTTNLPVMATLPEAGWVAESATADNGKKPTAQASWGNKQLVAEELAVIVPVHENTVEDATTDVLDEITKQGAAAIARKLDLTVLFGIDKPASWVSKSLLEAAQDAGMEFAVSTTPGSENDLPGSIYQAAGAVDDEGWDPDSILSPRGLRYRLANTRNADGSPIFVPSLSTVPGSIDNLAGLDAYWVSGRVWDRGEAEAFVLDSSRLIIGIRQDITVKFLDQATVGGINLAERDMVALRFKARYAYVLGDTPNEEGDGSHSPVAVVTPAGS